MNNRLTQLSAQKSLLPFLTCGDPDLAATDAFVCEAVKNGANGILLGIPFSDPTAEGPLVQAANLRALRGGVTTDQVLECTAALRQKVSVPLLYMTYANVIFSYGAERFLAACAEIGMDGLIVPDLPFEEKEEFLPYCQQYGVPLISMLAPTSQQRIGKIAAAAEGFLYFTCGSNPPSIEALTESIRQIRTVTDLPCLLGYSGEDPAMFHALSAIADGVIAETALMHQMAQQDCTAAAVGECIRSIASAAAEG